MNRIDKKFRDLRKRRKKAFIAFIMAGDPNLRFTKDLIFELDKQHVDIIELGVPFSDPLADGPTIQRSSERALRNRVNLDSVCNLVRSVRLKIDTPIVFLTYYNLIYQYGLGRFINNAKGCGVDGVIVPDLPVEESGALRSVAKRKDFSVIHLLAPTSSDERIRKIVTSSRGFIYYVSLTGTTGTRKELPKTISDNLRKVKSMTRRPVCVGFGISVPWQVKVVSRLADGVIVGSAIIKVIEKNLGTKDAVRKVGNFVKGLVRAIP